MTRTQTRPPCSRAAALAGVARRPLRRPAHPGRAPQGRCRGAAVGIRRPVARRLRRRGSPRTSAIPSWSCCTSASPKAITRRAHRRRALRRAGRPRDRHRSTTARLTSRCLPPTTCGAGSRRSASRTTRASSSTSARTGSRRRRASIFTLDYAGLGDRTALLDGGMPAWVPRRPRGHGRRSPPRARASSRRSTIQPIVVDAAYVQRAPRQAPGSRSSTARDAVVLRRRRRPAACHGAAAPHRPHRRRAAASVRPRVRRQRSCCARRTSCAALFTKAGVKPGDTVIGYCHIGQQATAMLFAARTLGHPVLLYDGSFEDWSRHADYPVENPAAKARAVKPQ